MSEQWRVSEDATGELIVVAGGKAEEVWLDGREDLEALYRALGQHLGYAQPRPRVERVVDPEMWPDPENLREAVEWALQDAQATFGSIDYMGEADADLKVEQARENALEDLDRCIRRLHAAIAFLDDAEPLPGWRATAYEPVDNDAMVAIGGGVSLSSDPGWYASSAGALIGIYGTALDAMRAVEKLAGEEPKPAHEYMPHPDGKIKQVEP